MEQNSYNLDITEQLIKKNNHIRGLSKDLKKNHMSILRNINFLYKENVVDFNIEGKNKAYFLKKTIEAKSYIFMTEIYKLIKLLKKYPTLTRTLEDIRKNRKVKMAILFGSYAKNIANERSDIDIYIGTKDNELKKNLERGNSKLSIKIGSYNSNNLLIKEIGKNHVIIKGMERYYEINKFFE